MHASRRAVSAARTWQPMASGTAARSLTPRADVDSVTCMRAFEATALGDLWVGLAIALFSAVLVWLVGDRVAHRWQLELRRRELDLEASKDFTAIYGEFYAVWKIWHAHLKADGAVAAGMDEELRQDLLDRSAVEEGRYNALVLKLVAERDLQEQDMTVLAMFREGQQCLRESLEKRVLLTTKGESPGDWNDGGAAYIRFKELAMRVADLVAHAPRRRESPGDLTALEASTRRDFSGSWWTEPVPKASWWSVRPSSLRALTRRIKPSDRQP